MTNQFVDNLYNEFEDKLWAVLGFGLHGLRATLNKPATSDRDAFNVDKELEQTFEQGGAPQLRWQMKNFIINFTTFVWAGSLAATPHFRNG